MGKLNVILTGFMATGKTTVGKLLAKQLGYEFVDTDELIVQRNGMTVAEIFRRKGEAAFRRMESELAWELADREGLVVSTGGRMMLDPANAAVLSRRGRVFCLVATPEEILDRVSRDKHVKRPLLEGADPLPRIVELIQERAEGYARFPQLMTSRRTPEEILHDLLGILRVDPDWAGALPAGIPR